MQPATGLRRVVHGVLVKLDIAGELVAFLWTARLWWMIPMVVMLLLLGGLLLFAQSSAVAPFIYTLF
ncbi:MAG: DUF5989 family protein [Candidatus Rokuibacteriota bacterium]